MDRLVVVGGLLLSMSLGGCTTDPPVPEADGDSGADTMVATSDGASTGIDPSATSSSNPTAGSDSAPDSSGTTAGGATDTGEPDTGDTGATDTTDSTDTGTPLEPIPCQPQEGPVVVHRQGLGTQGAPAPGSAPDQFGVEPAGGGGGFIMQPDGGPVQFECDIWEQDCPEGEKCNAWASGGGTWDATRCVPIVEDPDQIGDECVVEGFGASGLDSCDAGSMCFDVDPETNIGVCVEQCSGSPEAPICETENTTCTISNEGSLILCQPICNPLANECPDGQACYPIADTMVCAPDVSGEEGAPGDTCEFINVCQLGSYCAPPDTVPGCQGAGCCSPFCTIGDDSACLDGQSCLPAYPRGAPAECLEAVGLCGV